VRLATPYKNFPPQALVSILKMILLYITLLVEKLNATPLAKAIQT
jgi:hypothetical protein